MSNKREGTRLTPDRRREQIVEVAAARFARDGATNSSMSAIARDAKVARTLVYHYFPGKESLLEAVLQREADRLLAATSPNADRSPRENVERALVAYFDHFAASTGDVRDLYTTSAASEPWISQLAATNHTVQVDRILEQTGSSDTPEHRLALGAWLAFVEFTARHLDDTEGVDRKRAIELCVNALESAIGHPLRP